jgi:hypothetical protein
VALMTFGKMVFSDVRFSKADKVRSFVHRRIAMG